MYTKDKIKEILKLMIDNKEFEKIIKYTGYSSRERRKVKDFYNDIKDLEINNIPIIPLILAMPKTVMQDVLSYLLHYKVIEEEK